MDYVIVVLNQWVTLENGDQIPQVQRDYPDGEWSDLGQTVEMLPSPNLTLSKNKCCPEDQAVAIQTEYGDAVLMCVEAV